MDKNEKLIIIVKRKKTWSSSYSRSLRAAGLAASNVAIKKAAAAGITISYLENGVVVKNKPEFRDCK